MCRSNALDKTAGCLRSKGTSSLTASQKGEKDMNENAQSEFGKGLVICLVKFAEHADRWPEQRKFYSELAIKHPGLFNESDAVEMFFNGASDHLYDLEIPEAWQDKIIAKKIVELRDFGLMIGHGYTGRHHSEADIKKAYALCEEIALLIDEQLGLKPDIGQF